MRATTRMSLATYVLFLFLGCWSRAPIESSGEKMASVALPPEIEVAYTLTVPEPAAQVVQLSVDVACPSEGSPTFSIQRNYAAIEGLDRFIANVRAYIDGRGTEVREVAVGRWEVPLGQACGHVRLEYEVLLAHREIFGGRGHRPGLSEVPFAEDDWSFFLGLMVFLRPDHAHEGKTSLSINSPPGWHATTPWRKREDGLLVVASGGQMLSNYFAIGDMIQREEVVEGMPVVMARVRGRGDDERNEALVDDIFTIVKTQVEVMGRTPRPSFLVLLNLKEHQGSLGGSVRRDSIVLHVPQSFDAEAASHIKRLIAHEWFHGFQAVGPKNNDCQWLHEGFTDWMALETLLEAGLIDHEEWQRGMYGFLIDAEAHAQSAGNSTLPRASEGFFHDAEARRFSYSGGAALAFALDGRLRASGDERGLAAFLARLFGEWAKERENYTIDEVLALAAEHGGDDWAGEWRSFLDTPGLGSRANLVEGTLCELEGVEVERARLPIGWRTGEGTPPTIISVSEVLRSAEDAPLPGDHIVAIDEIRIGRKADYDRAMTEAGETVELTVERGGERLVLTIRPLRELAIQETLFCPLRD